jgi:MHS family proline/betaine transporter-like MFS transporter
VTVSLTSAAELDSWGWRIPFFVGAAVAASVWIARSTMHESPEFQRQQEEGTIPRRPLSYALRHHRAGIVRGFCISALGSITYYVGITYVPAFLTSADALTERSALWLSTIAAVAVILVTPVVGWWSDRAGRRPVLLALSGASAILPMTMFALMASGSHARALLGAVILACVAGGVSAVGAVATAEQFRGEARITGLALGATMATAIFGGLTPWAAQWLVERTGWSMAPGAMITVVALCVLPIFFAMRETAPVAQAGTSRPRPTPK